MACRVIEKDPVMMAWLAEKRLILRPIPAIQLEASVGVSVCSHASNVIARISNFRCFD
jgi:hypothetical protein